MGKELASDLRSFWSSEAKSLQPQCSTSSLWITPGCDGEWVILPRFAKKWDVQERVLTRSHFPCFLRVYSHLQYVSVRNLFDHCNGAARIVEIQSPIMPHQYPEVEDCEGEICKAENAGTIRDVGSNFVATIGIPGIRRDMMKGNSGKNDTINRGTYPVRRVMAMSRQAAVPEVGGDCACIRTIQTPSLWHLLPIEQRVQSMVEKPGMEKVSSQSPPISIRFISFMSMPLWCMSISSEKVVQFK
ncbi:hypothetical protein KCU59_g76, partial [Aureobasidium melanogenum]